MAARLPTMLNLFPIPNHAAAPLTRLKKVAIFIGRIPIRSSYERNQLQLAGPQCNTSSQTQFERQRMPDVDSEIEDMRTIAKRKVAEIYTHPCPVMIGGTPFGIELELNLLHELLFESQGRLKELKKEWIAERASVGANVSWFAGTYIDKNPDAEAREVADHVVSHWKRITKRLGLSLPVLPLLE